MCSRRVERQIIDEWIDRNAPNGLAKLSLAAGVSIALIAHARIGNVPAKAGTRMRLASALKVTEDQLFPIVPEEESA